MIVRPPLSRTSSVFPSSSSLSRAAAGAHGAVVPEIVDVVKRPFDHVRERLEPTVRMRRKAGRRRDVEVVHEDEWIQILEILIRKEPMQARALAVRRRNGADARDLDDRSLTRSGHLLRGNGTPAFAPTAEHRERAPSRDFGEGATAGD